jgi:hypothetical protein
MTTANPARNKISKIVRLTTPRIEPARDCDGWYVLRGDHGWLCGHRRQALSEFGETEHLERGYQ